MAMAALAARSVPPLALIERLALGPGLGLDRLPTAAMGQGNRPGADAQAGNSTIATGKKTTAAAGLMLRPDTSQKRLKI